jgi:multiple sugar transport system ATP-binding protein
MGDIKIENVRKLFKKTEALKGVSLEIKHKQLTVLLGPSGCGKTTLLRIVAGLEEATSGKIFIAGKEVSALPSGKRNIAMVFQNYAIFPHMSIEKNVSFGLRMKKFPAPEIQKRTGEAMELMHISNLAGRFPSQVSGGQRQRVAVARALAMKPEILLMDEPLSNLDALLRLEMRAELKKLLKEINTTTLYVTHDQVEAMSLADKIAILSEGTIAQYSDARSIYSQPKTQFVASFIGNPPMNIINLKEADEASYKVVLSLKPPENKDLKKMSLGIRAEHISVSTKKSSNAWKTTALVIEPLGSHLHITTKLANKNFRAIADINAKINMGDTIYLTPNADFVKWFENK